MQLAGRAGTLELSSVDVGRCRPDSSPPQQAGRSPEELAFPILSGAFTQSTQAFTVSA